jgi:hypothetical protein
MDDKYPRQASPEDRAGSDTQVTPQNGRVIPLAAATNLADLHEKVERAKLGLVIIDLAELTVIATKAIIALQKHQRRDQLVQSVPVLERVTERIKELLK